MLGCPASSGCECQLSSGTDSGGNSGATFEMARVISSISSPRAVACAVNIAERRKCERSDPRQRVHDHGTVWGAGPAETVQQTGNPQAAQCLLQIDPVRRQQDRHHVRHQLGQHTSAREGYRASEARVGPNADQQFGQRRLHHPFDEESVGYRASVVAPHGGANPVNGGLHLRRARNPERDGSGLGLVRQAGADHLHGDRKAELRRGARRFPRISNATIGHRNTVAPQPNLGLVLVDGLHGAGSGGWAAAPPKSQSGLPPASVSASATTSTAPTTASHVPAAVSSPDPDSSGTVA